MLATCETGPVWVVTETFGVKHYESAFDLPNFEPDTALKEVLNEQRFIEMLPLINWLRVICRHTA